MFIEEEIMQLNGHEILLRNARPEDAPMLIEFLRVTCGETRYLMKEPEEVQLTIEQEISFIEEHNKSEQNLLILAFVDGEYAGNCSFEAKTISKRCMHRVGMGIALYQKYIGNGLGRILIQKLIKIAKDCGFEQMELDVVDGNERAINLYKNVGFVEYGRFPNADKYKDGTYADTIWMMKYL